MFLPPPINLKPRLTCPACGQLTPKSKDNCVHCGRAIPESWLKERRALKTARRRQAWIAAVVGIPAAMLILIWVFHRLGA